MRSTPLRYVFLAMLALACIAPYAVVGHTYPIPTFYAEFVALVCYLCAAACLGVVVVSERAAPHLAVPKAALIPLVLAVVLVFQTLVLPTQQPTQNYLAACYLLAATLIIFTGYWATRLGLLELVVRVCAVALIAGGLFAVFCQVVQLLNMEARFTPFVVLYRIAVDRRPFGNMAQANHLASYIAFALAGSVYLVQRRKMPLLVWIPFAAIFCLGQALTVSRTPWLQTAVVFVGALLMSALERGLDMRMRPITAMLRRWSVPVLLIVVFVCVNLAVRWANTRFGLHLAESAADRFQDVGQLSPRLTLWRYGWTMFTGHPILGVGWGEFPNYQYLLVERLGRVEIANNSHDIVIDLLAKTGLVGALVVFGGLALWAIRAASTRINSARTFCFMLLGIFVMHALVEYPQQYMFFLLPAAFAIGLLETGEARYLKPSVGHSMYGLMTLFGLVMLYPISTDYHRAEVLYYGAHPEQQYRADPSKFFGAWGQYGLATLLPINPDALPGKLAMHRRAISLLPGETVVRRYALLLALAGRDDEAMTQVQRLKLFADALHDWPSELKSLVDGCDQQAPALNRFKARLVAKYGKPAAAATTDDDDDDSDDN
ncbi:MAG: PglL family O-oligosaccharyltransferase [Janthinobacterium lividum]